MNSDRVKRRKMENRSKKGQILNPQDSGIAFGSINLDDTN